MSPEIYPQAFDNFANNSRLLNSIDEPVYTLNEKVSSHDGVKVVICEPRERICAKVVETLKPYIIFVGENTTIETYVVEDLYGTKDLMFQIPTNITELWELDEFVYNRLPNSLFPHGDPLDTEKQAGIDKRKHDSRVLINIAANDHREFTIKGMKSIRSEYEKCLNIDLARKPIEQMEITTKLTQDTEVHVVLFDKTSKRGDTRLLMCRFPEAAVSNIDYDFVDTLLAYHGTNLLNSDEDIETVTDALKAVIAKEFYEDSEDPDFKWD